MRNPVEDASTAHLVEGVEGGDQMEGIVDQIVPVVTVDGVVDGKVEGEVDEPCEIGLLDRGLMVEDEVGPLGVRCCVDSLAWEGEVQGMVEDWDRLSVLVEGDVGRSRF